MSRQPLLEVEDLTISSYGREGTRRVLVAGANFRVDYGETVGIVGESGSGKSLTAKAVVGLLPDSVEAKGRIAYRGSELSPPAVAELRGSEIGLLMQDPFTMLNPVVRCGYQVTELRRDASGRKLSGEAMWDEAISRLNEVGITDPSVARRFPFQLSGGMRQRVALAACLALEPRLLIADEPSTALDVTTQREILALTKSLQMQREMGLVLITHNLRVAFSICDRVYVLYGGQILEVGRACDIEKGPCHPYTLGLLLAEPPAGKRLAHLNEIPGQVPAGDTAGSRCQYVPRCPWAVEDCGAARPRIRELGIGRHSACLRIQEIQGELESRYALRDSQLAEGKPGCRERVGNVPIVSVHGMSKTFGCGANAFCALRDVSIDVYPGESIGLVGESGSGKTTIARCIVGLEHPDSGLISVDGTDVSRYEGLSRMERCQLHHAVQIVFQDPYSSLNPSLRIGSLLSEAIASCGDKSTDARVRGLLEVVGLPGSYSQRKPRALSGGERQRVAIARALAVRPKVLLCDEPVSALDVSVQAQILTLFRKLQSDHGIGFVFISHDLAVVRQVTDWVYVLYKGGVVESGPTATVLDHPSHEYTKMLLDSIPRADPCWVEERARALVCASQDWDESGRRNSQKAKAVAR